MPHLTYLVAAAGGLAFALSREGASASVVTNDCWALLTCALLLPTIYAAAPHRASTAPAGTRPELTLVKEQAA